MSTKNTTPKQEEFRSDTGLNDNQWEAVRSLDSAVQIAAGAGTGKTKMLTERIAYAASEVSGPYLENPASELLAITFTEAAAAELTQRVRNRLMKSYGSAAYNMLDGAWIGTFHSIYGRILRKHALEIDLDPTFTIIEELDSELRLSEAICYVLEEASANTDSKYYQMFETCVNGELSPNEIRFALRTLAKCFALETKLTSKDLFANVMAEPMIFKLHTAYDKAKEIVDISKSMSDLGANGEKNLKVISDFIYKFEEMQGHYIAGALSDEEFCNEMFNYTSGMESIKKSVKGELKEPTCDFSSYLFTIQKEAEITKSRKVAEAIVALAFVTAHRFADIKRERNELDFDDLISKTHELFEKCPHIAKQYKDTFKLIMIDEFQDTDENQVDITNYLTDEAKSTLCTVGDEQQSIYAFRGADVSVFQKHHACMQTEGHVIQMNTNYRSHEQILGFANQLFGYQDAFGERMLKLEHGRNERFGIELPSDTQRIRVLIPECEVSQDKSGKSKPKTPAAADARAGLAKEIAKQFTELRNQGVPTNGMVVLLRSMTYASVYADAIREQGMECYIATDNKFFESPEVEPLIAFVHALANPNDKLSLSHAYASPLFNLCADDLLTIYDSRHVPDKTAMALKAEERFADYLSACSNGELVSKLVRRAIEESGWDLRLINDGEDGALAYAKMLQFVRVCEDIEERYGISANIVSNRLKLIQIYEVKGKAATLPGNDSQAVRIMTIHASKGLEFPVVALGEMGAAGVRGNDGIRLVKTDLGRECLFTKGIGEIAKNADTSVSSIVKQQVKLYEKEKADNLAENTRLFYVALTRARDVLICGGLVPFSADSKSEDPMVKLMKMALDGNVDSDGTLRFGAHTGKVYTYAAPKASVASRAYVEPSLDFDDEHIPLWVKDNGNTTLEPSCEPAEGESSILRLNPEEWEAEIAKTFDEEESSDAVNLLTLDVEADARTVVPTSAGTHSYSSLIKRILQDTGDNDDDVHEMRVDYEDENIIFDEATDEEPETLACLETPDGYKAQKRPLRYVATDFGSAFHEICEYSIKKNAGEYKPVSAQVVARFAAANGLDAKSEQYLAAAYDALCRSDCAAEFATYAVHRAELPFYLELPCVDGEQNGATAPHLTGSIDGYSANEDASDVFIIDYKTGIGGTDSEYDALLRKKYKYQASCYALAAMCNGAKRVRVVFVRPELCNNDDKPQEIPFEFTPNDKEEILGWIAEALKK